MKKFFYSAASVVMVCMLLFSVGCVSAADNTPLKFVLLGDSIASGYGVSSDQAQYGSLVSSTLGFEYTNKAVGGYRTSDLIEQLETEQDTVDAVRSADIVAISIGGNNALRLDQSDLMTAIVEGADGEFATFMLQNIEDDIRAIFNRLRELNPDCKIMLQNLYNPFHDTNNEVFMIAQSFVAQIVPKFAARVNSVVADYENSVAVDVLTAFEQHYQQTGQTDYIQTDWIHPSDAGHKAIADVYIALLSENPPTSGEDIKPVSLIYGDTDGDGTVNAKDVLRLRQHLAQWEVIISDGSDANRDGEINAKDLLLLRQYLADYEVEFIGTPMYM